MKRLITPAAILLLGHMTLAQNIGTYTIDLNAFAYHEERAVSLRETRDFSAFGFLLIGGADMLVHKGVTDFSAAMFGLAAAVHVSFSIPIHKHQRASVRALRGLRP